MMRMLLACAAMILVGSMHGMGILARAATLPTQVVMQERISKVIILDDFDKITKLSQYLATSKSVGDLLCKVGASLYIYNATIQCVRGLSVKDKNKISTYIDGQRSNLIQAVLQDNPALLAELKAANLL